MSGRVDDVVRLCCELSAQEQIKVAVRSATQGAAMAGGGAFVGAMLAGPPGMAAGGIVGSVLGSWWTSGTYRPLPQILQELPAKPKGKLYADVMAVLGTLDWTDAAQLIALVMGSGSLQQQVVAAVLSYVTKELHADVKYAD